MFKRRLAFRLPPPLPLFLGLLILLAELIEGGVLALETLKPGLIFGGGLEAGERVNLRLVRQPVAAAPLAVCQSRIA